jgi:hypothetical protein
LRDKNYEVQAPIEGDQDADEADELVAEIFRSLEIGLSLEKLFVLSPRLLRQAKKVLTKKRVLLKLDLL